MITTIIDQLNSYQGEDIWGDLITQLLDYDEAATDLIDAGDNTRFVLTDGTVLRWSPDAGWQVQA